MLLTSRPWLRAALLAPLLFASLPSSAEARQDFPTDAELADMLGFLVADGETPGIVIGILERDGSTRIVSAGTAGAGARPLGPRTVFEIGSINKTFTGSILADMVARGEVALEDAVGEYLPTSVVVPARNDLEITLLDLATHHSGLPRMVSNHVGADPGNPYADYTVEEMYAFLSGHELRRDPGTEAEYSNLGMGLLGHALGRGAGSSFAELVRARILEPLGMKMTGYALEGEIAAWMARGHENGKVVPYWFGTDAIHGAGGLRSNVEDMLVYLQANVGPPASDIERALRFAQVRRRSTPAGRGIGLCWFVGDLAGRALIEHGGSTGGFSTYIAFDPEKRIGFVQLTNTVDFGDDLMADFLGSGPPLAIPVVAVPRAVLERYVGAYEDERQRPLFVRLEEDGTLTVQMRGNVRFRMFAASEEAFFVKRAPWRITFTRDAAGKVDGLELDLEGEASRWRRAEAETPPPAVVAGNAVIELSLSAAECARSYTLSDGARTMDLRVFREGEKLMAQMTGNPALQLLRQSEHEFALAEQPSSRLVFVVDDGRAERLTLHQNGTEIQGKRKP